MAANRKPVLRGGTAATVDEQGRLKIPTMFKDILVKSYGLDFFVTSLTGENVFVYPLKVWEAHEERLTKTPTTNASIRKYLDRVNYFGSEVTMDKQGRILIPATLRDSAAIRGVLRILGKINFLDVWNEERFVASRISQEFSEEDYSELSGFGI
jgi:MraZ protein